MSIVLVYTGRLYEQEKISCDHRKCQIPLTQKSSTSKSCFKLIYKHPMKLTCQPYPIRLSNWLLGLHSCFSLNVSRIFFYFKLEIVILYRGGDVKLKYRIRWGCSKGMKSAMLTSIRRGQNKLVWTQLTIFSATKNIFQWFRLSVTQTKGCIYRLSYCGFKNSNPSWENVLRFWNQVLQAVLTWWSEIIMKLKHLLSSSVGFGLCAWGRNSSLLGLKFEVK